MKIYYFLFIPIIIFFLLKLINKFVVIPALDKKVDQWIEYIKNEDYDLLLRKTFLLSRFFPFHIQIQYYRALAYSNMADTKNAIKILNKILSVDKNFSDAYYMLAFINQYNYEDSKIALEYILKAIELNDTNAPYYNTASIIYESLNDFDSALKMTDKSLELNPEYVEAINNKGVLLFKQGKVFDALKIFQIGLSLTPDDPELLCNAANAYCLAQEYTSASTLFKKAYDITGEPYILYWLGGSEYLEGKAEEAEKHLRLSLDSDSENADANYLLSVLLSKKNLTEESSIYWNKAVELDPEIKNRVN